MDDLDIINEAICSGESANEIALKRGDLTAAEHQAYRWRESRFKAAKAAVQRLLGIGPKAISCNVCPGCCGTCGGRLVTVDEFEMERCERCAAGDTVPLGQ